MEKLNVFDKIEFEEGITREELHTYQPYGSNTFEPSDEIRICIQCQDLITSTFESFIYIEGEIQRKDNTKKCDLDNNGVLFLFEEIRFEMNGQIIDSVRKPGITSCLKNIVSLSEPESRVLHHAGWMMDSISVDTTGIVQKLLSIIHHTSKKFSACIPLNKIFGFAEDYQKVILNARQELVLIRSRSDHNSIIGGTEANIKITKLQWKVPHISVSDIEKLKLFKDINKNEPITIAFRKWDLYELPSLRQTKSDIWSIKTATNLEKPRYILIGFQIDRWNKTDKSASHFDNVNISNIKAYLNSEIYPYEKWNAEFDNSQYSLPYLTYANFQSSYYHRNNLPLLNYEQYGKCPVFVIDCSKQNESLKNSTVDVKLEFEANEPFKVDTIVYALILHDTLMQYKPISGEVKKYV